MENSFSVRDANANRALRARFYMKYTLQTGAVLKSVPAVREHTKSRLKSHFILSRVWASPHRVAAIRSIDRSGLPITRGAQGGSTCPRVSRPHFEIPCIYLTIRFSGAMAGTRTASLSHSHERTFVTRL